MTRNRWLFAAVLAAVLPFTLVACGDDDDDTADRIGDAASDAQDTAAAAAEDVQSAVAGVTPINVDLDEVNGSGVDGHAVITPEGTDHARASFAIDIDGSGGRELAAGIWSGSCGSVAGDPEYSLGTADDGASTERFDVGVDELRDGDFVLALRDGATVVACGEVA